MADFKPNHICKNPKCKKEYYACNYCTRTISWRSVACSFACYQEYMDLVIEARSKGKTIEVKPERIDMTEKEVDVLLKKPIEEVIEETKKELSDYADIDGDVDFEKAVIDINTKLNKKTSVHTKKAILNDE